MIKSYFVKAADNLLSHLKAEETLFKDGFIRMIMRQDWSKPVNYEYLKFVH